MRPLHDRMPVILDPTSEARWLDAGADTASRSCIARASPRWKDGSLPGEFLGKRPEAPGGALPGDVGPLTDSRVDVCRRSRQRSGSSVSSHSGRPGQDDYFSSPRLWKSRLSQCILGAVAPVVAEVRPDAPVPMTLLPEASQSSRRFGESNRPLSSLRHGTGLEHGRRKRGVTRPVLRPRRAGARRTVSLVFGRHL
jgi:hypothetical protein